MEGNTLFLDIETIPTITPEAIAEANAKIQPPGNYKKPETIAAWEADEKPKLLNAALSRGGLSAATGQVFCAAVAVDDGPVIPFARWNYGTADDSEAALLEELFTEIGQTAGPATTWVGHYHGKFDLPFLWQRAVVLNVPPQGFRIPFDRRPGDRQVVDLQYLWGGWDGQISLEKLSCLLLGSCAKAMSGEEIWPAVQAGRIQEVVDHCIDDLERTRACYRRFVAMGV